MEFNNIILDFKGAYGEIRFFGLLRENFVYDSINNKKTDTLESRVYKVLSMERGEEMEVTVPVSKIPNVISIENKTPVELVNHSLEIKGSPVTKGTFKTVELRGIITVDNIVLASSSKPNIK